jgi:hypothetical protein
METPKEYHYVYYSYEEYGRGYIGSRTCKCLPEEDVRYFGSFKDKTFKPTQKVILKDDYATREEAYVDEIILQEYYKVVENPHFANRAYQTSTKFYYRPTTEEAAHKAKLNYSLGIGIASITKERRSFIGKQNGLKAKEQGLGFHSFTFEERSEISKRNAKKNQENKVGIFSLTFEERSKNSRKTALKNVENKVGLFSQTKEKLIENGKKGAEKCKELGIGIFSQSTEKMKENGKKTNSQRWMCMETGYISTPSGLSQYQKKRGIDTSKSNRRRIL